MGKSRGQKGGRRRRKKPPREEKNLQVPHSYPTKSKGTVKIRGNYSVEIKLEFRCSFSLEEIQVEMDLKVHLGEGNTRWSLLQRLYKR